MNKSKWIELRNYYYANDWLRRQYKNVDSFIVMFKTHHITMSYDHFIKKIQIHRTYAGASFIFLRSDIFKEDNKKLYKSFRGFLNHLRPTSTLYKYNPKTSISLAGETLYHIEDCKIWAEQYKQFKIRKVAKREELAKQKLLLANKTPRTAKYTNPMYLRKRGRPNNHEQKYNPNEIKIISLEDFAQIDTALRFTNLDYDQANDLKQQRREYERQER